MRLLAIETSADLASIALLQDGELTEERFPAARRLCETLAVRIQRMLEEARGRPDVIAVGLGPGSFTGLRIGVATAKALAHAWGVPLGGRCSLELAAAPLAAMGARRIMPLAYARRGWVYAALYEPDEKGRAKPLVAPAVMPVGRAGEVVAEACRQAPVVVCGPGNLAAEVAEDADRRRVSVLGQWWPTAGALARVFSRDLAAASVEKAFSLRPMYLLASQAERIKGIDLGMSR